MRCLINFAIIVNNLVQRRLEYQDRPNPQGVSAFRHLLARLPPRAHSIYYRDDIGNISTSQMKSDSKKVRYLGLVLICSLMCMCLDSLFLLVACRQRFLLSLGFHCSVGGKRFSR